MIFSHRLLRSFFLPPGPQERKTDNSLLVTKYIIGGGEGEEGRDFKIVGGGVGGGGSIKMEGQIFRGVFDPMCLLQFTREKIQIGGFVD